MTTYHAFNACYKPVLCLTLVNRHRSKDWSYKRRGSRSYPKNFGMEKIPSSRSQESDIRQRRPSSTFSIKKAEMSGDACLSSKLWLCPGPCPSPKSIKISCPCPKLNLHGTESMSEPMFMSVCERSSELGINGPKPVDLGPKRTNLEI